MSADLIQALEREAVAVVEGLGTPAGKKLPQPILLWYVDLPNMIPKVLPGEKLYTATTVHRLIAEAVERERSLTCGLIAAYPEWIGETAKAEIIYAIRARGNK